MLNGLYAITPEAGPAKLPALLDQTRALLAGGCRLLQYRAKQQSRPTRQRAALALKDLCRQVGAKLLINDDVPLALAVGADGVHLGQSDLPLAQARALLGPDALIGITCHDSLALARAAQAGGADYLAFGRFFSSGTKPEARPAPLALLSQARQQLSLPLVAIGGINGDNAGRLIEAGAQWLAVCQALYQSQDPQACARRLLQLFETHAFSDTGPHHEPL